MADQRQKDKQCVTCGTGLDITFDGAQLAVLMDIRDEMKRMNGILNCSSFLDIPNILLRVSRNTAEPRKASK